MPLRLHASPLLVAPGAEPVALATFRALAAARFAPSHELLALLAPEGLSRDLLDAWVAAGLLHQGAVPLELLKPEATAYLALTAKGAREFAMMTGRSLKGISRALLRRSAQTRAHEVAKGSIVMALLAAEREQLIELTGIEAEDKRLATSAVITTDKGPSRIGLQADLFVGYAREHKPAALLVEVDRGTVSVARMEAKYRGYLAWKAFGGPERDFNARALRIVTTVPNARRLEQLHAAALKASGGRRSGLLLFALHEHFSARYPERLVEPVARVLDPDSGRHVPIFDPQSPCSLPPRAASPQVPPGSGPPRDSLPAVLDESPPRQTGRGNDSRKGALPALFYAYAPISSERLPAVSC
jgi:hypothetical protein